MTFSLYITNSAVAKGTCAENGMEVCRSLVGRSTNRNRVLAVVCVSEADVSAKYRNPRSDKIE